MAEILKAGPVAESIRNRNISDIEILKSKGIKPTLAVVRVGERPDDIAYENSILKACDKVGVEVESVVLDTEITQESFENQIIALNENNDIHGILLFMPLPKTLDGERARMLLDPKKDVDGITYDSLAGVFTGKDIGFPPCTAEATMEILHFYGIDPKGKKAAVIGRSLVIGKPVAMMLMKENATVVNCHTGTENVPGITKEADILIASSGRLRAVDSSYVKEGQVVIDVGINWDDVNKKIAGDVDFDAVEPIVKAITPVPGGVGTVTTAVLVSHVVEAAKSKANI